MEKKCAKCKKEMNDLPLIRYEDQQPVCPACLLKEQPNGNQIYLLRLLENGKKNILTLQSHIEGITINGGGYCNQHEKVSYTIHTNAMGGSTVREETLFQSMGKLEITILWQSQTLCLACFIRKFPEPANKLIEFLSSRLVEKVP